MSRWAVGVSEIITGEGGRDWSFVAEAVRHIERLGFDSFWKGEHHVQFEQVGSAHTLGDHAKLMMDPDTGGLMKGTFESVSTLSAVAAVTTRLRVGTYVNLVALHNPLILAHQLSTLDQISAGRLFFGIGAGWLKEEFDAFGISWDDRGAITDEKIGALKALWSQPVAEFNGRFVRFPPVISHPKPIQVPHPPILIGGASPAALRRVVALGDGWIGNNMEADDVGRFVERLHAAMAEAGRDMSELTLRIGRRPPSFDREGLADLPRFFAQCEQYGVREFVCSVRFPVSDYFAMTSYLAELLGLEAAELGVGG